MSNEKLQFQYEGIKWLIDMEMVQDPKVITQLNVNVMGRLKQVRDIEYIIAPQPRRQLLAWLDVSRYQNWRRGDSLCQDTERILKSILPRYEIRAVTDRKIFEMAMANLNEYLKGVPSQAQVASETIQENHTANQTAIAAIIEPPEEE